MILISLSTAVPAVTIFGMVYALIIGIGLFISHLLFISYIRGNGVKLGPSQFPQLYVRAVYLSDRAGLEQIPDTYVLEAGGSLNAIDLSLYSTRSDKGVVWALAVMALVVILPLVLLAGLLGLYWPSINQAPSAATAYSAAEIQDMDQQVDHDFDELDLIIREYTNQNGQISSNYEELSLAWEEFRQGISPPLDPYDQEA